MGASEEIARLEGLLRAARAELAAEQAAERERKAEQAAERERAAEQAAERERRAAERRAAERRAAEQAAERERKAARERRAAEQAAERERKAALSKGRALAAEFDAAYALGSDARRSEKEAWRQFVRDARSEIKESPRRGDAREALELRLRKAMNRREVILWDCRVARRALRRVATLSGLYRSSDPGTLRSRDDLVANALSRCQVAARHVDRSPSMLPYYAPPTEGIVQILRSCGVAETSVAPLVRGVDFS